MLKSATLPAINKIFLREMFMKKSFALITSLCVIAISLACLTPTPAPPSTPNPNEIATIVSATITAQPPLPTGRFADANRCVAEHE